ncbi:hypothetical protein [Microbacterium lacticum]
MWDAVFAVLFVAFLVGETVADQQQWDFHQRKAWGGVINPGIIGAVLLTLLFLGSTVFTESISAAKYPAYAEYRRTTSMLVPLPRRRVS